MRESTMGWAAWARLACIAVLKMHGDGTAADVSDGIADIGRGEGVPAELWARMTPATVGGVMRGLQASGVVKRVDVERCPSSGRDMVVWGLVDADSILGEFPPLPSRMSDPKAIAAADADALMGAPMKPPVPAAVPAAVQSLIELQTIMARHRAEIDGAFKRLTALLRASHG